MKSVEKMSLFFSLTYLMKTALNPANFCKNGVLMRSAPVIVVIW